MEPWGKLVRVFDVNREICLRLACCFGEIRGFTKALRGNFVEPNLSASSSRLDDNILPTGRNFYTKELINIPSAAAYKIGLSMASKLINRFYLRSGRYLKHIAISVWATSNMRTGGDDIAMIYALVGARPIWCKTSMDIIGFEVIPLHVLRRPRVRVLVRISGLFRDMYPKLVKRIHHLLDSVNKLREYSDDGESLLFSSAQGTFGTGIQEIADSVEPFTFREIGEKFITYGSWEFTGHD